MGLNVDLNDMFGRIAIICPNCSTDNSEPYMSDFDIECCVPRKGRLTFPMTCCCCEKEYEVKIKLSAEVISINDQE